MSEMKKNPDELGALWSKTSSRGEYMTGTINGQPVVVFGNEKWTEGGKQPKWRVLKAKPKASSGPVGGSDIPF
jgi:hypothetical protein